ncbi:response regulator [Methanothrix sp.]|uniref:response regulator n=1 Tax=Methanothrix sp. TaxID=90426 RepID=UPI003BB7BE32
MNILVVDDDCTCRSTVLHMLKKLGIRADAASNGLEAIAALEKKSYDLVLMDIQMPKMNGIEATRAIFERWPQRPRIVIVSDCSARRYRDLSLDAGAVEFLAKPAKLMEICAAISRHLPEMRHESH